MAAVAMNIVATVMQANFSTVNIQSGNTEGNDFQSILDSKSSTDTVATSKDLMSSDNDFRNQVAEDIRKNMSQSSTKELKQEVDKTIEDSVKDVVEDVVKKMAKIMDVSEEEVKEALDNISLDALLDGSGILEMLMNAFELENPVELLTDEQLSQMYKELEQMMATTFENIDLSNSDELLQSSMLDLLKTESREETVTEIATILSDTDVTMQTTTNTETAEGLVSETEGSETGGNSNSSGDNNPSFMNEFTGVLDQVVTQKTTTIQVGGFEQVITQQVSATEVLNQIVTQMRVSSLENVQTLSFQLQPENLGKVAFSVSQENGILTGSFVAENNAVKEAIEASLVTLRSTLADQGIKVDDIKVVVGNTSEMFNEQDPQKQFHNQQQQSKKQKRVFSIDEVRGLKDEELAVEDILLGDIEDHSVEFSA